MEENKELSGRQKEVVKSFVEGIGKQFQELYQCKNYHDIKKTMIELENTLDSEKWAVNFQKLCKLIDE